MVIGFLCYIFVFFYNSIKDFVFAKIQNISEMAIFLWLRTEVIGF